jgi:hypothetical protein
LRHKQVSIFCFEISDFTKISPIAPTKMADPGTSSGSGDALEFVSQDAVTLDVTSGEEVVDADPCLESLIVGDPNVVADRGGEDPSAANPILMLDQDQVFLSKK